MTRWKAPDIQRALAEFSARGLSAEQIAELLGVSVGAVAGAMSRYGLFARSGPRLGCGQKSNKMVAQTFEIE